MQRLIFEQTNSCLRMDIFLFLKGRTEFLWENIMQVHHK